jgi:PPE-repeat protein
MFYTKNANVTTTAESTIVTIPSGYVAHWNMLFVSNIGGSTNGAGIYVAKADSSRIDILGGGNVSSKDYILLTDAVFVLQAGDAIKAYTTAAGDMEFVVTFDLLEQAPVFVNFNGS